MGQAYPQSHSNKQTPDLLTPGQLKPRPPHSSVCPCASAWLARESSSSSSAVHSCACSWVPSLSPQGFRKQMVPLETLAWGMWAGLDFHRGRG